MRPPIPDSFNCPITHEICSDPVLCADGYTYDRGAIEHWLTQSRGIDPDTGLPRPPTSPITNLPLLHIEVVPNRALKSAIDAWFEHYPDMKIRQPKMSLADYDVVWLSMLTCRERNSSLHDGANRYEVQRRIAKEFVAKCNELCGGVWEEIVQRAMWGSLGGGCNELWEREATSYTFPRSRSPAIIEPHPDVRAAVGALERDAGAAKAGQGRKLQGRIQELERELAKKNEYVKQLEQLNLFYVEANKLQAEAERQRRETNSDMCEAWLFGRGGCGAAAAREEEEMNSGT